MNRYNKSFVFITIFFIIFSNLIIINVEKTSADPTFAEQLANAILHNTSTLNWATYSDCDNSGNSQAGVFTSLGVMQPTDGSNFAVLSTGTAGFTPSTSDENYDGNGDNPGDERGSWFDGGKYGDPRDQATLTMSLNVPSKMHYLHYDVQFFSTEAPEYIGSSFNDKLTITVYSPFYDEETEYIIDVNTGYFELDSRFLDGSGFDVFAQSGYPSNVDIVDTINRGSSAADAMATDLIPLGGETHKVKPFENILVTIDIKDTGDNMFDSAVFIDNLHFSGEAEPKLIARKFGNDINGGLLETGDIINYTIKITNTGGAAQENNPGPEFEDYIPENTTLVTDSIWPISGTSYDPVNKKITWNGRIPGQDLVKIGFKVTVNSNIVNNTNISNRGILYWDPDEDGDNDKTDYSNYVNFSVSVFQAPDSVQETFEDDEADGKARQQYQGRTWFETDESTTGNSFEVASSYHYDTPKSFKTKLRSSEVFSWDYSLDNLDSNISYWEIRFKCGNSSENSQLQLDFKNSLNNNIAKLQFKYTNTGTQKPTDWVLTLSYYLPASGWIRIPSNHDEILFNSWYKLRIERNIDPSKINYYLYRDDQLLEMQTATNLGTPFKDLNRIDWYNSYEPISNPIFFWDEHIIGLSQD